MKPIHLLRWLLLLEAITPGALNAGTPRLVQSSPIDAHSQEALVLESSASNIWVDGVGSGFRRTTQSLSLETGGTAGFAAFGGSLNHNLALVSLSYGHMLGAVVGEQHWYRGNWELRGELFTGAEFSPGVTWGMGLTPHLRYNFATGTRWIPFIDGGAGASLTGERGPDLGGAFEFNLQAGTGVHWFVRDNLAITAQILYLHVSSAGLYRPNLGLNTVGGLAGVTWCF